MVTKEQIALINNELQQIYVRGIDTLHMANALAELEKIYKELSDSEKKEENKK